MVKPQTKMTKVAARSDPANYGVNVDFGMSRTMAGRTDPRERRRYPAWCFRIVSKSGAALLELSRPE